MASILHTRPHGRMASIAAVAVATALALASAVPAGVGPGAAGPFRGCDHSVRYQ
jgi:hypothetical protein